MAPVKKRPTAARCHPIDDWLLPTAHIPKERYKPGRGVKRCRSTRIYKNRLDPRVEFPRIRDFEARFRLPPNMVEALALEFQQSPFCSTKVKNNRGRPIPVFNKVCYALRFLATGAAFTLIRDTQGGCSTSSISRCVRSFVKFLVWKSQNGLISFPKKDDLHEAAIRFRQRYKMEDCIGCIDGSYVAIKKPVNNEGVYVNRHAYHALNCLLVTDSEQRFTFVESSVAGSNHDMAVLENCSLGPCILGTERLGDYFLLGDSGYGLSPQIMTPLRFQNLDEMENHERRFQAAHVSARNSVERAIGQLKMRWQCLSKHGGGTLQMDPLHASWVMEACCALHNLCVDWGVRELRPGENKDPDVEELIQYEARLRIRRSMRQAARIVRQQPPTAPVREKKGDLYRAGLLKRARYIHRNYGGPRPNVRQPRTRNRR